MKLLFIAYDGIVTQSVFDSQILKPLEMIRKRKGAECHLIAFENIFRYYRDYSDINRRKGLIQNSSGIICHFLPRIPSLWGLRLTSIVLPYFIRMKGILRPNERAIAHARGSKGGYIGLRLKQSFAGIRLVFDARASEPEQYVSDFLPEGDFEQKELPHAQRKLFERLIRLEEYATKCSNHIFSQSEKLTHHLMERYGVPENKFTTFPNAVSLNIFNFDNDVREEVRKELGLQDRLVILYCGTVHPYQLPEKSVGLFKKLLLHEPESYFLALSFTPQILTELLKKECIPAENYRVMQVNYSMVPRYMSAGDVGLLFRVQNAYSRTSSPVKFAEYLSCGLFVVTLEGIGDVSSFVREHDVGLVLKDTDNDTLEEGAKRLVHLKSKILSMETKLKISSLVKGPFSLDAQIEEKWKYYQKLLAN